MPNASSGSTAAPAAAHDKRSRRRRPRPRAEQVRDNREALLAAARRVFIDRGFANATLDAIAEEAGFSKGVVYSQFESKADLFFALLDRRFEERERGNRTATAGLRRQEALAALAAQAEGDDRSEHRWTLTVLEFRLVAARDPELNRRYAVFHRRTVEHVAGLIEEFWQDEPDAAAANVSTAARYLVALSAGSALERAVDPGAFAAAHREIAVEMLARFALRHDATPGRARRARNTGRRRAGAAKQRK